MIAVQYPELSTSSFSGPVERSATGCAGNFCSPSFLRFVFAKELPEQFFRFLVRFFRCRASGSACPSQNLSTHDHPDLQIADTSRDGAKPKCSRLLCLYSIPYSILSANLFLFVVLMCERNSTVHAYLGYRSSSWRSHTLDEVRLCVFYPLS